MCDVHRYCWATRLFQRRRAELSLSNQGCSFTLHLIHCDCRLLRTWAVPIHYPQLQLPTLFLPLSAVIVWPEGKMLQLSDLRKDKSLSFFLISFSPSILWRMNISQSSKPSQFHLQLCDYRNQDKCRVGNP